MLALKNGKKKKEKQIKSGKVIRRFQNKRVMPLEMRCEYKMKNEVMLFLQVETSIPEEEEKSGFALTFRVLCDSKGGWLPVTPGWHALSTYGGWESHSHYFLVKCFILPIKKRGAWSCNTSPVANVCTKESFHKYCFSELSADKKCGFKNLFLQDIH